MANKIEFNILVAGDEKFSKELSAAAGSLENFSKATKSLGRNLGQIGSTISMLGAAISGPLVLAFNNAAKSSYAASEQVKRFQDITSKFYREISDNLVPVFKKLNDILSSLFNSFSSLDGALKAQLIQGALVTGVFLALTGVLTIIIAKFISLAGNIAGLAAKFLIFAAVHPVLLAIGIALAIIVGLMFKFRGVADAVMNIFQALFVSLQNGFLTVKATLEEFTSISLRNIANILEALAKIPGPQQEVLQGFADNIRNVSVLAHRLAYNDVQAVIDKAQELGTIFVTGRGSWAQGFDELKLKAQELFNLLNGTTGGAAGGSPIQGFVDGFMEGLERIKIKLFDLKQQGIDFANTLQSGLATAFSDIILGAKSAKEAFAAFGQTILKAIVDFIAQWLAFQVISRIGMLAAQAFGVALAATLAAAYAPAAAMASLASFGGNAVPAQAGIISTVGLAQLLAVPRFARGAGDVRDDTLGLFNQGEIIIPKTFSDSLRSGELVLAGSGNQPARGGNILFDFSNTTFNGVTESFVRDIFTRASEAINNRTLSPLPA